MDADGYLYNLSDTKLVWILEMSVDSPLILDVMR